MAATVFDPPERFVAGTVGPPGGRTFFLQASGDGRLVSVSLEKVQVSVLADRVNDLLDTHAEGAAVEPWVRATPRRSPPPIEDEFRVDTLALAWDPERRVVVIECHDQDPEEAEEADLRRPCGSSSPRRRRASPAGAPPSWRPAAPLPVLRSAPGPDRPHLPPCQRIPTLRSSTLLTSGNLTPVGRIVDSSNGALCARAMADDPVLVIHKPEASERRCGTTRTARSCPRARRLPRERRGRLRRRPAHGAARRAPRTGSVQLWVGPVDGTRSHSSTSRRRMPCPTAGSSSSRARPPAGRPVVVSHSPEPALRTVAVLDAVLNNSDRKGGHLLRDGTVVRGCDHGVSLGVEPKLRTVLWGWAGEEVPRSRPHAAGDPSRGAPRTAWPTSSRRSSRGPRSAPCRSARHPCCARAGILCRDRGGRPSLAGAVTGDGGSRGGRGGGHRTLAGEVVARTVRPRRARPR